MIRKSIYYFLLLLSLNSCALGRTDTWVVDGNYPRTSIHGMVVSKKLIKGYDKNEDELIYDEVTRILRESGEEYSYCKVVDDSLIISTRNDQIFIKIDCKR